MEEVYADQMIALVAENGWEAVAGSLTEEEETVLALMERRIMERAA